MKPTIKASLIAAAIALSPFGAQAAGLDKINVLSGLGEPLNAEIQINATQQELQSLTARIAPPEVFLQANVPYAGFVPNVRVAVENRGGRSVLKLSSNVPVNEAVASLIIQVNWDDGRLSRTYNFLLDPPDLAIRAPRPVEPPVVAVPPLESPPALVEPPVAVPAEPPPAPVESPPALLVEPQPVEADPPPVSDTVEAPVPAIPEPAPEITSPEPERQVVEPEGQPAPPPVAMPAPPPSPSRFPAPALPDSLGGDYAVKYGDKLSVIASGRTLEDVTLDQMMLALYRANPTAFIGNNINRLKTGAILKMPSADDVRNINSIEARKEVRVQARDFNAWRERLAGEVASRPASDTEEGGGRTRSIDTVPPPAERNRDTVVIASGAESGQAGDAARLRQLEENIAATQNTLKDATERVSELEKINSDLNKLLDMRSQEVARLQTQLSKPSTPPAPTPEPQPVVPEPVAPPPAPEPVPEPVAPEPPVPEPAPEPVAPEPEPEPPVAPVQEPSDSMPDPLAAEDEDPLLELLSDPQTLGIGALIIALLGAFLGFRSWQRKRSDIGLDTLSQEATSMFPSEATSIFGDNGGQSVDTTASSVIHTDFSQTGLSIDTNEGVDPVAEADVYMAYGRDSQAEEILNDALKADPKRGAIYVKLLEIYAQRQDLARFGATAVELHSRTQGQGRDWEKAVQMGRRLDPANPLYSGKSPGEGDEPTMLPGLEPEEPPKLNLGAARRAPSGSAPTTLADLDFGASPASAPAANPGQLKETVALRGQLDDMLSAQTAVGNMDVQPEVPGKASINPNIKGVDFQLGSLSAESEGDVDFDLGRSNIPSSGKRPISVTVSRTPGVASRQPAGVASRQPVAAAQGNRAGAAPIGFDQPGQEMTATVVLPSVQGGDERSDEMTMDLEKTSFDPRALDFDLDLDSGAAAPASGGESAGSVSEVDTKLELARAYEDMGDTEGALELLREVAAEGNAAQKAEAQGLIAKLG